MSFLKQLRLKTKLLFLCGFFLLFTIAVGVTSEVQLEIINDYYSKATDISVPKMRYAYQMFLTYRQIQVDIRLCPANHLDKSGFKLLS